MTTVKRILFVCLGNIVRSPLAEALFLQLAAHAQVGDLFDADSAGTGGWHAGEQPDHRMRSVAAQRGLQYTHRARKFERSDFTCFDLIVAMDQENQADLLAWASTPVQRAKIHLLREFDPLGSPNAEVPDPYYDGQEGFEKVFQVIERSCTGLLQALVEEKV